MAEPTNEQELRDWLATKLKLGELPDQIWADLESDRRDALNARLTPRRRARERGFLLYEARRLCRAGRAMAGKKRIPGRSVTPAAVNRLLEKREVDRARALSNCLGRRATELRSVRKFRLEILGGGPVAEEKATALLGSPAPRFLTHLHFAARGIPVVGHRSRFVDYRPHEVQPTSWSETTKLRVEWEGGVEAFPFGWDLYQASTGTGSNFVSVPIGQGRDTRMPVMRSSVLDELRELSVELAGKYPWSESDAVLFILTGKVPLVPAVRVGFEDGTIHVPGDHYHLRIAISAQPWVSPGSVRRVYDYFRRVVAGRGTRPLSSTSTAIFDFVDQQRRMGKRQTWDAMMEEWNRTHSAERFVDYRIFRRAYDRIGPPLLFPDYRLPPRKEINHTAHATASPGGSQGDSLDPVHPPCARPD